MKRILMTTALLVFAYSVQAQQVQRKRITNNDLHKVEKKEQSVSNDISSWTKQQCEEYLKNLDAKEKAINADPKQREIALEEGWFANAERERKEVKERLNNIK